jgi:ABC-2 type transport system ATP-binding protein
VRRGEVLGFLGPNGAGKSTTMRLLLDQIRPTAGRATVLGLDARADSLAVRRRVGYLPGDFALYPKATGRAVLDHFAALRGGVDAGVRDALAERFEAQLDRPVRDLSTGNRQKLGLIQAFMHEPELLVLDEPTAGLDPLVQQRFHALLGEVAAAGRTVFLSSHTLSEVERVADRVAILRRGRLVVVDTLDGLRAVAVRRLEVEVGGGPEAARAAAAALAALDGVREASVAHGAHVAVAFEGSADAVVKTLARFDVRALRSRDDDLEEIFLRFYRDGEAQAP